MSDVIAFDRLATTLLHFLWQGIALAALAGALMRLSGHPTVRYAIGCAGLLSMVAAPLITFTCLTRSEPVVHASWPTDPAERMSASVAAFAMPPAQPTALGSQSTVPLSLTHKAREAVTAASPYIAAAWITGVAIFAIRHLVGIAAIARLRRCATAALHPELRARLERVARRMKFKRTITLLGSAAIDAPCVVGWLRPAILWPASAMTGLTPIQLDSILAHELAHIRRHDYLVNLLQAFLETLGFYHPAVWWLSRRVRQEREHCCDDVAAAIVGDAHTYAKTLVLLESSRRHFTTQLIAANGGTLMVRIHRLVVPARPRFVPGAFATALVLSLVMIVACIASRTSVAHAEEPTTQPIAATLPTTQPAVATIGRNDLVQYTIKDLAGAGTELTDAKRVSETGKISLPYLGQVEVIGLTAEAAAAKIGKAYAEAQILPNAVVRVAIPQSTAVPRATAAGADGSSADARILQELAAAQKRVEESQDRLALAEERFRAMRTEMAVAQGTERPPAEALRELQRLDEAALAKREPFFARLLAERDTMTLNLERLTTVQGPNSPPVVKLRDQLVTINSQIDSIAQQLLKNTQEKPTGNYYIAGAVSRPGVFELGGHRISVVQALIAAGYTLDTPAGVRIVRRWPDASKETTLYVVANLATGAGNDVTLKPDDTLFVGRPAAPGDPATMPSTVPSTVPATMP